MSVLTRTLDRWLPHPWVSGILFVTWLLLANSASFGHLLLALTLALAIPAFTRLFWTEKPDIDHYRPLFRLLPLFLWDVVIANVVVAGLILNVRRRLRPAWLLIPLDLRDDNAIAALASMITLTPGTLSAKLTPDRLQLLVHIIDTDDPDAEIHRIKQRYERPLQELFDQ